MDSIGQGPGYKYFTFKRRAMYGSWDFAWISLVAPRIHLNHFGVDFDAVHMSIMTPLETLFLRFLGKCYASEANWIKT